MESFPLEIGVSDIEGIIEDTNSEMEGFTGKAVHILTGTAGTTGMRDDIETAGIITEADGIDLSDMEDTFLEERTTIITTEDTIEIIEGTGTDVTITTGYGISTGMDVTTTTGLITTTTMEGIILRLI